MIVIISIMQCQVFEIDLQYCLIELMQMVNERSMSIHIKTFLRYDASSKTVNSMLTAMTTTATPTYHVHLDLTTLCRKLMQTTAQAQNIRIEVKSRTDQGTHQQSNCSKYYFIWCFGAATSQTVLKLTQTNSSPRECSTVAEGKPKRKMKHTLAERVCLSSGQFS